MNPRVLSVALVLALLTLPAATPASAAGTDTSTQYDAAVVVSEADLQALLDSGALGDYSLVTAADLGLDEADLAGRGAIDEDSLLTPGELGLDSPDLRFGLRFGGFSPFFRGFVTLNGMLTAMFGGSTITTTLTNVRVPFFRFRAFSPVFGFHAFSPVFSRPFFGLRPFGRVLVVRVCC
jgi:hypothetical protein